MGLSAFPAPDPTQSILITPLEPRITLDVAGRRTEFLVDTGAASPVLTLLASFFSNHDCTDRSWGTAKDKGINLSSCLQNRVHYYYSLLFIYARMPYAPPRERFGK